MKKPFRISDIDLNKILYSEPVYKNEKKNILLKYLLDTEQTQFLIQTPELVCIEKPKVKNGIYEINIGLKSDSSKKLDELINFFEMLDKKIVNLCESNNEWFDGKQKYFNKIVREDINYSKGVLKLKVKDSNISKYLKVTKNKQKDVSNLDSIVKDSKVKMVLDIFGLWIKPYKDDMLCYGIYLKPLLIDHEDNVEEEVISFIEDSDSDNDVLDTEVVGNITDVKVTEPVNNTETSLLFNVTEQKDVNIDLDSLAISSELNDVELNVSNILENEFNDLSDVKEKQEESEEEEENQEEEEEEDDKKDYEDDDTNIDYNNDNILDKYSNDT